LPEPQGKEKSRAPAKHYVRHGDEVFVIPARAYSRLLRALALSNAQPDLATFGKRLPPVQDLANLKQVAQEYVAKDSRRTTGNYGTRAELLDHVWALRLLSHLSDTAIARHVGVSTATLDRILRTAEGRPIDHELQGFRARRFRGLFP
jgi:hypothetical protein